MRVSHLELRNFLSYEHLDLDLTVNQQIAVTGPVGAGKSTLLDAILWALYGRGRASADKMIRLGQTEASVYLDAIIRGDIVQVRRTRKRDRSTSLTLHVAGEDRTKHTIAETEDEIASVIGMDYDALMAGPIMVQGKSDELMRLGPSERRDLLSRLFGLEEYERYLELAKQRLSSLRDDASRKEAVIEELDRLLAERLTFERIKRETSEALKGLRLVEAKAEDKVIDLRYEAMALVERERQLQSAKDLVAAIEREIDATDQIRGERQKAGQRLMRQAEVIDTVPCGGEGIYATCPLLKLAFDARDQLGEISLDDLDQELIARARQVKEARKEVLRLSDDSMRIDSVKADLADADAAWAQAREKVEAAQADLTRVEADLDRMAEAESRRKALREEYERINADITTYEVLADAFHRNGIPSVILERGLPMIEQAANDVLARMPGGFSVRLLTQRQTKAKSVKETLDVVVNRGGTERDYELLSGGQRFQVDFALRLGIAAVLAHRAGAPIDTLWLDEGWGTQDAEGREAMLEAIAAVSNQFGLIMVVSHVPEVSDRFPVRLDVSMEGDVSAATYRA